MSQTPILFQPKMTQRLPTHLFVLYIERLASSLLLDFRGGHSHEALGKEFVLLLPGLLGCNLSHHLLAAGTPPLGKFAHVLAISLALLLLCIDAARLELGAGRDGGSADEGGWGKGLSVTIVTAGEQKRKNRSTVSENVAITRKV